MEKKSKKSIIIGFSITILLTLTLLGLTYAYFRTRVIGNQEDNTAMLEATKIEVTYSDDKATIEASNIDLNYIASKEFTVENTGDEPQSYTIVLDNVENTFERTGDWTWILKNTKTNEETTGIINRLEVQTVLPNISIDPTIIDSYKLTIKYNEKDEDQSIDMGKSLSLRINIRAASEWDKATEGTLLYALKTNNEVVEPITVPGQEPAIHSYKSVTGSALEEFSYTYENNWTYATGYTFDKETQTFDLTGVQTGVFNAISDTLKDKYVSQNGSRVMGSNITENLSEIYQITYATNNDVRFLYIAPNNYNITEEENILSSAEDDYGTSYYFRGMVNNNYLSYSGMCWKIVRVLGNGGIKITLLDSQNICNTNSDPDYTSDWEQNAGILTTYSTDFEYLPVDYEISNAYNELKNWATKPIKDSESNIIREQNLDTSQIMKVEWCHDISEASEDSSALYYGGYSRLNDYQNATPTLKCNQKGYNNSKSKKIIDNIGLLTVDEMAFAGSTTNHSLSNYNYLSSGYSNYYGIWTMSPRNYYDYGDVYAMDSFGTISSYGADYWDNIVRPTVVLKPDVKITTDSTSSDVPGTLENPYVIVTE